jgi:hypothetical protein
VPSTLVASTPSITPLSLSLSLTWPWKTETTEREQSKPNSQIADQRSSLQNNSRIPQIW